MGLTKCIVASSLALLVQSLLVSLQKQADEDNISIGPAERLLLLPAKISETAQKILDAVKADVAQFLLSGKSFTADKLNHRK
jgi:hypothetical protein